MTVTTTPLAQAVCHFDALIPERGVAALLGGLSVAIFRTHDDQVFAVSNIDPFTGASVMARGIVGTRAERPIVWSPLHKQAFDLATGECLDEPDVRIAVLRAEVVDGLVRVSPPEPT